MSFTLHPTLADDTVEVTRLSLSRVLLMKDSRFPWLILVPERDGVREIPDRPYKINAGSLGNVVPQLHVHVVARTADDPAWPGPVWGSGPAVRYGKAELEELRRGLEMMFQKG